MRSRIYQSPLGRIVMSSDGEALNSLIFSEEELPGPMEGCPVLEECVRWLDIFFSGRDPGFTPPLKAVSTPFRQTVWELLLDVPYGHLISYGELARAAEEKTSKRCSARAVGGAVGQNPISLIIPCHRVIGSDGSLTGYGWGLEKKRKLLELEGSLKAPEGKIHV